MLDSPPSFLEPAGGLVRSAEMYRNGGIYKERVLSHEAQMEELHVQLGVIMYIRDTAH